MLFSGEEEGKEAESAHGRRWQDGNKGVKTDVLFSFTRYWDSYSFEYSSSFRCRSCLAVDSWGCSVWFTSDNIERAV
jgi:hypothetical protein